jgi:hypothetical protein
MREKERLMALDFPPGVKEGRLNVLLAKINSRAIVNSTHLLVFIVVCILHNLRLSRARF